MERFRFVIITGMSGAGKTNFMQKLEDMGYYCVDNLPPVLIARFADLCWKSTSNTRHVAVVSDIRGGSFFDALPQALDELNKRGIPHEVVFLEALDEALVRRYMETRRQHPLAKTMRIQEGIEAERKILAGVRAQADVIIDTTAMKPADLQEYMGSRFGAVDKKRDMQITVFPSASNTVFPLMPIWSLMSVSCRILSMWKNTSTGRGVCRKWRHILKNHRLPKNSKENFLISWDS